MIKELINKPLNQLFTIINNLNKRWLSLIIVILILLINILTYKISNQKVFSNKQKRVGVTGLSHDKAQHFAYFHYYKNLFPLATLDSNLTYSEEGADNLIDNRGENLIMEFKHWSRLGENARIFTYLPNSLIKGSPENPTVKLFNALIFTLGLIICYLGFARVDKHLVGVLIVLIVQFTPFYRYEVYQNENVFGLLASLFLIVLGLNTKIIFNKVKNIIPQMFVAILSGLIVGCLSEIRGEVAIVIVSVLLAYLVSKLSLVNKGIIIFLLFGTFFLTKKSIHEYFDYKFEESYSIVQNKNGHVYNGGRNNAHIFWHAAYCGLGDFDEKYNYEWNDKKAYEYAIPILEKKIGRKIKYSNQFHLDEYYDDDRIYYKKFDEIPEYDPILKEKVLHDIKNDPSWYITIIIKRVVRILNETLPFHGLGWILLPFVILLFFWKRWNYLKLILVSLPLSFTPLFIYSGGFSTYNSMFGIVILSVIFVELFVFISNKYRSF